MAAENDYQAAWDHLNLWSALTGIAYVFYLPVVGGVAFFSRILWPGAGQTPAIVIALVWMALLGLAVTHRSGFRCPRCGNRFFEAAGWRNPFTRRCQHCDLRWGGMPADPYL